MNNRRPRHPQRGSAMLVTLIVIGALLAGGAVLVSLQISSNRSSDLTRSGMSALYCAEAGLTAARPLVATNYLQWNAALLAGTEPAWLSGPLGDHSIDGDTTADYEISLRDNDDEVSPNPNDLTHDNDQTIFIVSKCIKFPDTEKEVVELVTYTGTTGCLKTQQGGCSGDGNSIGE
jgi:hypothetical protein